MLCLVKKNLNNKINIQICNNQIPQSDQVKYLGILINKHLKWKPYIDELTTSISKSVGILYHFPKYLSNNNLKKIYHSLVKSRLQYGILLWGNANQSTLHNLNKVNNRALRYVTQLPYRTNLNTMT